MIRPIPHFDLTPYFSTDWFSDPDKSSIRMSVYNLPTMTADDLSRPSVTYDFATLQARAVISQRSYTYYDLSALSPTFRTPNSFVVESDSIPTKNVKDAVYLAVTTPSIIDGVERKLTNVEDAICHAVSMMMCVIGRSVAYEHVFDTVYHLNGKDQTIYSLAIDNYWVFGRPSLGRLSLKYLSLLENKLSSMPVETKNKILLSLRWFKMACHDKGIDAFLKFWISIEILSMPKTDIRPLRTFLANAYCIPVANIDKHFGVGRIYGFRCHNVHDGFMNRIDGHFLRYISCIFSDVLFQILELPPMHKAAACLDDPNTGGLEGLMKQITVPKKRNKNPKGANTNVIYVS